MKKRVISTLLILVMVLGTLAMAGCGKKAKTTETKLDKDHVFKMEELGIDLGDLNVSAMNYDGENLYLFAQGWGADDGGQQYALYKVNLETKESSKVNILTGFEDEIAQYNTDGGGEMVTFGEPVEGTVENSEENTEENSEESTEGETTEKEAVDDLVAEGTVDDDFYEGDYYSDENGEWASVWIGSTSIDNNGNLYAAVEYTHEKYGDEYISDNKYYLNCWDGNGEIKWSQCIYDSTKNPDAGYFYISNVNCLEDGSLIYTEEGKFNVVDVATGEPKKSVDFSDYTDYTIYVARNSKVYALAWNEDYSKQSFHEVDVNSGKVGEEVSVPDNFYMYSTYSGGDVSDFTLIFNQTEIHTFNIGDETSTEVMDAIDSDVDCAGFGQTLMLDSDRLIATYQENETWNQKIGIFTKVKPEDVVEKQAILLAGVYLDSDVKKKAIEFNKRSDKYRIQMLDYAQYATMDDFNTVYTKLNNDIISGKMPDLLVVSSAIPFESYINKGLIEDLEPFFENDPDLNKDDYLFNVFEAYGVDGKIYCLTPSFSVSTLVGKTKDVGSTPGWTMEQFVKFAGSLPEGCEVVNGATQEGFLFELLYTAIGNYVDFGKGTCNFNDGDFAGMLQVIKDNFPKEFNYDDEDYWNKYDTAFRDGRAALYDGYFSDFRSFKRTEVGTFGEPVTWIGFPAKEGNGAVLHSWARYAMSSTSAAKEGCFEFMKDFLSDDYQESLGWNFPVKISALEKMAEESQQKPYWEDENGEREYYDDSYYVGGQDITIDPLTEEETTKIIEFLKTITLTDAYDQDINTIISEETEAFFEGQKSAEDVCNVIQSRVSMYLSENN